MGTHPKPEWQELKPVRFARTDCPVCKSADGSLQHRKRLREYEIECWLCNACGALYPRQRATVDSLRNIYASKDFFDWGEPGGSAVDYFDFIGGERYLRPTAAGRIRRIQRFQPSGKMLEIASAAGFFLIEAKNAGFDVSGVEFSAPMAKYASERWGVPVTAESIELVDLPPAAYDVIASWGVMTIIQDPLALIRKIHQALKPGGIWAFNTYYHDGIWAWLTGKNWNITGLQFSQVYSRKLILDVVGRHGFELLSRRRDTPHTDILKISDQLGLNFNVPWLPKVVKACGIADMMLQVPLPDVLEYIWRKK